MNPRAFLAAAGRLFRGESLDTPQRPPAAGSVGWRCGCGLSGTTSPAELQATVDNHLQLVHDGRQKPWHITTWPIEL